jgi:hypothetical protein
VFQDAKLELNGLSEDEWLRLAGPHLGTRWQRARDVEEGARRSGITGTYLCFELRDDPTYSPALLVLSSNVPGEPLSVINIISRRRSSLSHDEYNALLARFVREVLEPSTAGTAARVSMSSADVRLEDLAPAEVAESLRRFSVLANKGTGASHPMDQERWFAFVVAAHRTGRPAEPEMIARWLVEIGGWAPVAAHELAIQYEQQVALLAYYDRAGRR